MKILYDISMLGLEYESNFKPTGISRVVENVARQLLTEQAIDVKLCSGKSVENVKGSLEYVAKSETYKNLKFSKPHFLQSRLRDIYLQKKIYRRFELNEHSNKLHTLSSKAILKYLSAKKKVYTQIGLENLIKASDVNTADIYHSPFFGIPQQIKKSKIKSIFFTSYDILPILYPQYFPDGVQGWFQEILNSLTPDTWILCISHATRTDLLNYLGKKIDPNKVFVTPLAASESFYQSKDKDYNCKVREKYKIGESPYFLSVCTLEPRKNIDSVVRAFANLLLQESLPDVNLVLVGNKGWLFDKIFEEIDNAEIKNKVIITGFVADEDLAAIYSDALAFIYPSFYEGFGLPPLESMQCGTPVITSNTSSLPEVVGDAAIMINPHDLDALSNAMLSLYKNPKLRDDMSAKSTIQADKFSWKGCADLTVEVYRKSLQS